MDTSGGRVRRVADECGRPVSFSTNNVSFRKASSSVLRAACQNKIHVISFGRRLRPSSTWAFWILWVSRLHLHFPVMVMVMVMVLNSAYTGPLPRYL